LRARASAIVTGIGTVLRDNPSLTVRDQQLDLRGRVPLRVVLDTHGTTPRGARLITDGQPTLILSSAEGAATLRQWASESSDAGLAVAAVRVGPRGGIDVSAALSQLADRECNEVLVEAGPTVAGSFIVTGLVDEVVLYLAPVVLGDSARPLFALPAPLSSLEARYRFAFHDVQRIGDDLRVTLRPTQAGN
jgi:diaminohydroxyphosphoribosylaminopyrimidine deaminase/5-amino-6-(5-phosphoribosylamino)uracil reductase